MRGPKIFGKMGTPGTRPSKLGHHPLFPTPYGSKQPAPFAALRLCVEFLALSTTTEFWLNLQTDYDLRLARRGKLKAIARQVKPLKNAA